MNFSTRPDKFEELIKLIVDVEETQDEVKTIYWQDIFLFTYDVWKSADINTDFPNLGHKFNNFNFGATIAMEFQILSCNFKASKKVDIVKAYSFWLLGIYFLDDPI